MIETIEFPPSNLAEAIAYFKATPEVCFELVRDLRWPNGVACPGCGCLEDHSFISTRHLWRCRACKTEFSVRTGTIFEDSPLPLWKWLTAIWLIANAKNGISSHELHRSIGVTQKTAWFMLHRIRLAMQETETLALSGQVQADETYSEGKDRNMHVEERKALVIRELIGGAGKTIVFGMLERGGKVVTKVVKRADRKTLARQLTSQLDGHAALFTDGHKGYNGMSFHFKHLVVDHAIEYVCGQVHEWNGELLEPL